MKTTINQEFPLSTRSEFTKVDCNITISVDGKELPNMPTIAKALEDAIEIIKQVVKDSYKVPERVSSV